MEKEQAGPAESFVGQLGVDESAAEVSTPQEGAEQGQSAEGMQEGNSAAEEASSRREAAGPAGADPSGDTRGRRRGRGAFRDVDDEGPGGVSASAVLWKACMLHRQPRRRLFVFHGLRCRGTALHMQARMLPSHVGGGWRGASPCKAILT